MIKHIGTQKIETERLLLRRFESSDANDIFNRWANDPENTKYLTWNVHKNISETKKILEQWLQNYQKNNYYRWCITLKGESTAIGGIDITKLIEEIDCGEIGYVLAKEFWNRGIMTEALIASLNHLFAKANFNRIVSGHDIRNFVSGRVLIKGGMRFEGIAKFGCRDNLGKFQDSVNYAITKDDWKASRKIVFSLQ
ncbi:GNAT family acetyltransferase [Clostridia bacterium]|nr:GNAT family acetyltransferase [Clostridia bacterium]